MSRSHRVGPAVVLAALAGLTTVGCDSGETPRAPGDLVELGRQGALAEVGEMFKVAKESGDRTPRKAADLSKYSNITQSGFARVQDGEIVVLWGAPLVEGDAATVLAYEKSTPDSGGYALMQDGTTVKRLTADEFKSAPKAPAGAAKK